MHNKTELVQHFIRARNQVRALLPEIDVKMEIYPGWTIKEVLAHLSGWDDATILAIQKFTTSEPPLMTAIRGIDFYNSQTIAEREDLSYEQIVREWEWVREQLIPMLHQLTEKELATVITAPWGTTLSIFELLNIMVEHEEEHTRIIQKRMENPDQAPDPH